MIGRTVSVSASHGPVNTGDGSLTVDNSIRYYGVEVPAGARWAPRRVARDELERLYDRFVHPARYREAREKLLSWRTVLLSAAPGSGRTAAAQVLLHDLACLSGTLHELTAAPEDERGPLARERVGAGDQMWLNLANADDVLWEQVQSALSSFRETLRERGAYLVLILPERRHRLRAEFEFLRVEIGRPLETEVLARHLRASKIDLGESVPLAPFAERLGPRPSMRQVSHLVALTCRARDQARPDEGPAAWLQRASAAVTDQSGKVRDLVRKLQSGSQRALLLTVAMLHESELHEIQLAAEMILRVTAHPPADLPLLAQDDLATRLATIGAQEDQDGRVSFLELGYDTTIREHFWNSRPDLRPHLINWIDQLARSPGISDDSRAELAARVVDQCVLERYPDDFSVLMRHVQKWATGQVDDPGARAASHVLRHGLSHKDAAVTFRQRIYYWSIESKLHPCLVRILVEMCAEVMAERHSDQAMVRLHHLARRHRGMASPYAALLRTVAGSQSLRRQMFERLARTFRQGKMPDRARWEVDTGLFLTLSAPAGLTDAPDRVARPLLDELAVREHLAACWRGVLVEDQVLWNERVESWLEAAAGSQRYREVLLELLVVSCDRQVALLARLYGVACSWADAAGADALPARGHLTAQLRRKIRAARRGVLTREPV